MARVWISDKPKRVESLSLAWSGLSDVLMISITSSILSEAMINPSKICALSSAFRNSNVVLRTTTWCLKRMNCSMICCKFNKRGRPSTKHMLLTENEVCRAVNLYNLFNTTLAIASRLISKTIRIPFLSDSSLKSEIPSIFLSFTKSAIFLIISALFT